MLKLREKKMNKEKKLKFYFMLTTYIVILGILLIILNFVKVNQDKILLTSLIVLFAVLTTLFTPDGKTLNSKNTLILEFKQSLSFFPLYSGLNLLLSFFFSLF